MCTVVQLQTLEAGETLSALSAAVVLLVLVGYLVRAEAGKKLEAFAARRALVWRFARMRNLVDFQALCGSEGLATGEARKLPLCNV